MVIDSGVTAGDQIIITDIIPVMKGLPIKPIIASDEENQLARDAFGNDSLEVTP